MIIGFTGTRRGVNTKQDDPLFNTLVEYKPTIFLHGACTGADEYAVEMVRDYYSSTECTIIAYPGVSLKSEDRSDRSERAIQLSNEVLPEQGHFSRNRKIVQRCHLLIAVTHYYIYEEPEDGSGGGTFFTIQHAEKLKRPTVIIWADGRMEKRNFTT